MDNNIAETLAALEQELEPLMGSFRRAGDILARIRDEKLYRLQYASFEDYCQQRWHFSRQRAAQLISALEIDQTVNNCLQNESQARLLKSLKDPELMKAAVAKAQETANLSTKNTFAASLVQAVQDVSAKPPKPAGQATLKSLHRLFLKLPIEDMAIFLAWANETYDTESLKDSDGSLNPMP